MNSRLGGPLGQGSYSFRVESFTAVISSDQISAEYHPSQMIYLKLASDWGRWPKKFWPGECRIACGTLSAFDSTDDGQLVLGLVIVRPHPVDKGTPALDLIADWTLAPSLLAALNHNLERVQLAVTTATKVEDWDGQGFIPVISFSLTWAGN